MKALLSDSDTMFRSKMSDLHVLDNEKNILDGCVPISKLHELMVWSTGAESMAVS